MPAPQHTLITVPVLSTIHRSFVFLHARRFLARQSFRCPPPPPPPPSINNPPSDVHYVVWFRLTIRLTPPTPLRLRMRKSNETDLARGDNSVNSACHVKNRLRMTSVNERDIKLTVSKQEIIYYFGRWALIVPDNKVDEINKSLMS